MLANSWPTQTPHKQIGNISRLCPLDGACGASRGGVGCGGIGVCHAMHFANESVNMSACTICGIWASRKTFLSAPSRRTARVAILPRLDPATAIPLIKSGIALLLYSSPSWGTLDLLIGGSRHSYRKALIGLFRSTLALGIRTAKSPIKKRTSISLASTGALIGLTQNNKLESSGVSTKEKPSPAMMPATTGRKPVSDTRRTMWPGLAPRAKRIPISFVRRVTAFAVIP